MAGLLLTSVVTGASCRGASDAVAFDETRARAHIEMLATSIGSRPLGTPANARAREYLVRQLQSMGFDVRLQRAESTDSRGTTAPVVNVIATRTGPREDAIALVSHYDSQPDAPGALDDALGVAVCLESARVLVAGGLGHSLFVLLTDGEELGLMGAKALVTDLEVRRRLRAFLNFDGTGAAGPGLLFEVAPGWSSALDAWRTVAPAPVGSSFYREIYRRLPNDTDFTTLRSTGAMGLNFAPIGDAYAYHNDRDVASRIQPFTLGHLIGQTIATVRGLDAAGFETRNEQTTFFTPGTGGVVAMGPIATRSLAILAIVVGVLAWGVVTRDGWRSRGPRGLVMTVVAGVLAVAAVAGTMVGATALLRATRSELNPWYASPHWFFTLLATIGVLIGVVVAAVGRRLPERWRPFGWTNAVWWLALPVWVLMTAGLEWTAPAASYLAAVPLFAAAPAALMTRRSSWLARATWAIVAVLVLSIWLGDLMRLLTFVVPLFGWVGVVAPAWTFAALLSVGAVMIVPPILTAFGRAEGLSPRVRGILLAALAAAMIVSGVGAWSAEAYSADRPERRSIRYVQDEISGTAWWEVAGNERALGFSSEAGGVQWRAAASSARRSEVVAPLRQPFVFNADVERLVAAAPAEVDAHVADDSNGRATLTLRLATDHALSVQFVLPEDLVPVESTIAGRQVGTRWTATYFAPPPGLEVRIICRPGSGDALRSALMVVTRSGLPGGRGPFGLPGWLPTERATWQARSVFVRRVLE